MSLPPGEDAEDIRAGIDRVSARGWFILGPEQEAFEPPRLAGWTTRRRAPAARYRAASQGAKQPALAGISTTACPIAAAVHAFPR